jgi:hypothetical protein
MKISGRPMLIVEVLSAALYLAHPELDPAPRVGVITELRVESRVNFVSVARFIRQEFDDHSLFVFHDTINQMSVNVT